MTGLGSRSPVLGAPGALRSSRWTSHAEPARPSSPVYGALLFEPGRSRPGDRRTDTAPPSGSAAARAIWRNPDRNPTPSRGTVAPFALAGFLVAPYASGSSRRKQAPP